MGDGLLRVLEFEKIRKQLAEMTVFSGGRRYVEELLPSYHYNDVKEMLKETACAESCLLKRGTPPMGGAADIRACVRRLEAGGVLNLAELMKIRGVLRAARCIKKYFQEGTRNDGDADFDIIESYVSGLTSDRNLENILDVSIISEDELSDSAGPELRAIRRRIREAQESVKDKINDFIRSPKYSKYLQDSIITIRGDRYVVPVKQEHKNSIPGLVHDSSASGQTLFVEPMTVVEANNKIKELKIKEQIEIERIIAELTAACAEISNELAGNYEMLAKLDFAFAKGKLSLEQKAVAPELNDRGVIKIIKGRHPLLEPDKVVPIDFRVGGDTDSLIITGPNTGGKTVTLKTVGLFTLMLQCGLNIPAAFGTKMSVFGSIFADIGDEQSIEQSLSTFSAHMRNIVDILNQTDERSLVLFDELGAGTDPAEGAALATAVLETVRHKGAVAIATTHYSELKIYALTTAGVENASCEFDVVTLRPTYRLLIGVPGKSNAFAISEKLGLSVDVINRAKEFLTAEDVKFEDVMITLDRDRKAAEKNKAEAETIKRDLEIMKLKLAEKSNEAAEYKERLLREANEKAYEIYETAGREAAEILSRLREIETRALKEINTKETEELRLKLKRSTETAEEGMVRRLKTKPVNKNQNGDGNEEGFVSFKTGDFVEVVTLHQKGTIITGPKSNGDVVLRIGNVKVNGNVVNLRKADSDSAKNNKGNRSKTGNPAEEKRLNASLELDVRGMSVDEAEPIVDKYLDDSALANIEEIRIIHGKGTGILRTGVQAFLRGHKHVRVFRTGVFGEGGDGVTVVQLK